MALSSVTYREQNSGGGGVCSHSPHLHFTFILKTIDRERKRTVFNFIPVANGMIQFLKKCTSNFFNCVVGHLFPAVRGQVEDKNCEEGDAHAGDDQVHLVVVVISYHVFQIGILLNIGLR